LPETGRVDFYLLAEPQPTARLRFACRLAEKAWHLDNRVHLRAGSAAEAAMLDELLWTFRQGSFVPHELVAEGAPAESPVTIGHGPAPPPPGDLLINLTASVPEFEGGFARVAEIVDGSEEGRRLARERYRDYRERGREAATHNIGSSS
jgi:DNA polymerase-3 subunit chi